MLIGWPRKTGKQCLYPLSGQMSCRKILWNLEAETFEFRLFQSLWNLTGTSEALPRSNFRAIRSLNIQFRGFETSPDSEVRVNTGPGSNAALLLTHCKVKLQSTKIPQDKYLSENGRSVIPLQIALVMPETLLWRHNGRDGVSNHQFHDCLLKCSFRHRSQKHQSSASLAFVRHPVIKQWPLRWRHNERYGVSNRQPVTSPRLPAGVAVN